MVGHLANSTDIRCAARISEPRDHAVFIYGVVMIPIAAGLGWLYKDCGIWAAALAHTVIDVVLMARILTRNQDPYATGKQADPVG